MRFSVLILVCSSLASVASAQTLGGGRAVYQDVHAEETEPLDDELGVPRTPRLELSPHLAMSFDGLGDRIMDSVGFGLQGDLLVPLGPVLMVGARVIGERRFVYDGYRYDAELVELGRLMDTNGVARVRMVNGSFELAIGAAVGASFLRGAEGGRLQGWNAGPHLALRAGSVVAFRAELGFTYRRYPDANLESRDFRASIGLSFLLWSYR